MSRGLDKAEREALALRVLAIRQAKVTAIGLLLLLVPIVITWKSVEHAHKLVRKGLTEISPGVEMVGGIGVGILILLGLLVVCWALGWLVTRTVFGERWRAWERAKFLGRSPVLQKYAKELTDQPAASEEAAPTVQPALARIGGTWQPCVVVETSSGGWTTVFVPQVPTAVSGHIHGVPDEDVRHLDVDPEGFRKVLADGGRGSSEWYRVLGEPDEKP